MRRCVVLVAVLWLSLMALSHGMDNDTKSLRTPQFSGKQEDFQMWWMRFKAYAMILHFTAALGDKKEADLPDEEEEKLGDTKDQKSARKRNLNAIYHFTMAFTTEALMGIIFKAQTTEWPSGLAYLIVKALFERY
jgi:hypothetical protein